MRITVGGRLANDRPDPAVPMSEVSSSWTILITCWPGVRLCMTSAPSARSFTAATNSRTTPKLTSASSSASRISRIARLMSSSVRRPWPRRPSSVAPRRSDRESNIAEA